MEETSEIIINKPLLRKVVRAIEKGVGEDVRDYLESNHKETNNSVRQMPGDNINENLRNMVVGEGIELIPFKRSGWDGRILIDRINQRTYTITTKRTLASIPKKKDRHAPHYLQSLLYGENRDCKAKIKQITFEDFGVVIFDKRDLEEDYNQIMGGYISTEENYHHYIIVYEAENGDISDIIIKFLDKDFDIVDEKSLNDYIMPDFSKLTELTSNKEQSEEQQETKENANNSRKGYIPKIKKEEKKNRDK